ncbi:MAG: transcription antitermination factor NusB [Clostridia bacterium]|jgi:N utilization substance protein B|nr:transcription antitermination factor NusB [Clostridia bacterium]
MRRIAREDLFKLIFEFTFYNSPNDCTRELLLLDESLDDDDREFVNSAYRGIMARVDELNEVISAHLAGYRLERVYRPDYVILLVATYELLEKTAPTAVVINEAVELAKKFGTGKSGGFINGVLAKIQKDIA